jgi:hypothetical protein
VNNREGFFVLPLGICQKRSSVPKKLAAGIHPAMGKMSAAWFTHPASLKAGRGYMIIRKTAFSAQSQTPSCSGPSGIVQDCCFLPVPLHSKQFVPSLFFPLPSQAAQVV